MKISVVNSNNLIYINIYLKKIKALTPLVDSVGDKMKQYIDQSLSKDASFSVDARNV